MKTLKKGIKYVSIFLSMIVLFQGCTVYKKANVTMEQAVNQPKKTRVMTADGNFLKFKYVIFENNNYYGVKKTKSKTEKTLKKETKYVSLITLCLFMLQSCYTSKQTIDTDSGSEIKKVKLFNVWVIKMDNSKIEGKLYSANLEGITLAKDRKFNEEDFVAIKASEISKIKLSRKGQLGKSALIGGVSGGAIGALVGYSKGDEDTDGFAVFAMNRGEKAVVNGIVFGVVGTGLGLIIGAGKKKIEIDGDPVI